MKKSNNKGFSLVELIIVIAIMAILAGAIAPALIRYIDKSRKSNDLSAAKTIKTAVETAMSNEDTYAAFTDTTATQPVLELTPGGTASSAITEHGVWTNAAAGANTDAKDEIFHNLSDSIPKIKYKKDADGSGAAGKPDTWYVQCSTTGQVEVYLGNSGNKTLYELVPETCKYYQ